MNGIQSSEYLSKVTVIISSVNHMHDTACESWKKKPRLLCVPANAKPDKAVAGHNLVMGHKSVVQHSQGPKKYPYLLCKVVCHVRVFARRSIDV